MISFAQNQEDVLLARAFAGRERGFYIDVGAWHPVEDSVTKHFYDSGWSGINVEPASDCFAELARERPRDVNLQLALGERRETRTLHLFPGTGLSTLSGDLLAELDELGLARRETPVEVATLREVCERHAPGEIDFLKIDVEGWEGAVLRGGDWRRFRPRVVLVEAVVPNPRAFLRPGAATARPAPSWQGWERYLLAQGYDFCWFDGLNRFYVRREDAHLAESLRVPPNVYDRFEPWALARAREALARAEAEIARLTAELEARRSP